MHYVWIIIIGFLAGLIARWISPAPNNPQGFILTCILGIIGAFVATWLGSVAVWKLHRVEERWTRHLDLDHRKGTIR